MSKLVLSISKFRGKASKSEVLGLSLSFAEKNLDDFLSILSQDLQKESMVQMIMNPANGDKTDARKVKKYLYA